MLTDGEDLSRLGSCLVFTVASAEALKAGMPTTSTRRNKEILQVMTG